VDLPSKLYVSIGGYPGPSYALELCDEKLAYSSTQSHSDKSKLAYVQPTAEAWSHFQLELDGASVWTWKSRYENPEMVDGTSWSATIHWGERSIHTSGSNKFPKSFRRFLRAIQTLVGGRQFE
jgi:hypothetical protein